MAATYLRANGYETGTLRATATDSPSFSIISTSVNGVKTGTYCLDVRRDNGWVRYTVPGTPDNCSIGLWCALVDSGWTSASARFLFQLTTGEYIGIYFDQVAKTFDAYVDGVKVADGTVILGSGALFNIQLYSFIDNAGFIRCKIGGTLAFNYNGDTLPIGGAAAIQYVYLWNAINADAILFVDDLVIATDDYTGDCRVEWLAPTADTGVDDWTPTTGPDSYQDVDAIPADDVDYIYTATNTDETELDCADWAGAGKTPVLVSAIARMEEDVATAETINLGVDSGGLDDTTPFVLADNWLYEEHNMELDPNAGPGAWVDAAIDACKLRVEAVI